MGLGGGGGGGVRRGDRLKLISESYFYLEYDYNLHSIIIQL